MTFNVTVKCDAVGCREKKEVNQVGALPVGWVGVTYPDLKINIEDPNPHQPQVEVENVVFCGWKCLHKFITIKIGRKTDGKRQPAPVQRDGTPELHPGT